MLIKKNDGVDMNILGLIGILIFLIPTILDRGFGVVISDNYRYVLGLIGGILLVVAIIIKAIKK